MGGVSVEGREEEKGELKAGRGVHRFWDSTSICRGDSMHLRSQMSHEVRCSSKRPSHSAECQSRIQGAHFYAAQTPQSQQLL